MARKPKSDSTKIEYTKHQDSRVNIPTQELKDFVAQDEVRETPVGVSAWKRRFAV